MGKYKQRHAKIKRNRKYKEEYLESIKRYEEKLENIQAKFGVGPAEAVRILLNDHLDRQQ